MLAEASLHFPLQETRSFIADQALAALHNHHAVRVWLYVVPVHRKLDALGDGKLHSVGHRLHGGFQDAAFSLSRAGEHPVRHAIGVAHRATVVVGAVDADADAGEVSAADRGDDRAHAVVPTVSAPEPDAHLADSQVDLIVNHQQLATRHLEAP